MPKSKSKLSRERQRIVERLKWLSKEIEKISNQCFAKMWVRRIGQNISERIQMDLIGMIEQAENLNPMLDKEQEFVSKVLDLAIDQWGANDDVELPDGNVALLPRDKEENGCFVEALVWVSFEGTELDKEKDNRPDPIRRGPAGTDGKDPGVTARKFDKGWQML